MNGGPSDGTELETWHGQPVATWRSRWGVPELRVFRTVGSTNDVGWERARAGAPTGAVVLADAQSRGRGQHRRYWTAPAGDSLSLSMVIRPPSDAAARLLTLRLGLAAAQALDETLPLELQLKWPNDLLAHGRKVGGILCEAGSDHGRVRFVIAGIGLNLRTPAEGWPPEIAGRAGSLADAAGRAVPAPRVAGIIAAAWTRVASTPYDRLTDPELEAFAARDALQGRTVTVDGEPRGVARGITPAGALRAEREGALAEITTGTVRALEHHGDNP